MSEDVATLGFEIGFVIRIGFEIGFKIGFVFKIGFKIGFGFEIEFEIGFEIKSKNAQRNKNPKKRDKCFLSLNIDKSDEGWIMIPA